MKNTWIAVVAVVMLVSANVYAADSLVLAQATPARQAATQSRTKNSVLGTNKKAARQARREAVAKARAARREAARQGRAAATGVQNAAAVVASQAAQEESVMEKFDEVESMMLANDVVEEIKTAQEQAVQDEEKVLSPSAPSK